MKLSHLAHSQAKHQADSTTQGPILLSTIIYIWFIEQNPFFCNSSVIRYATCLSSPSSRGERPREKAQGAVNPAKSDSPNLGKLLRACGGAQPCREFCWPKPLLGRLYHADAGTIITLAMIMRAWVVNRRWIQINLTASPLVWHGRVWRYQAEATSEANPPPPPYR